MIGGILYLIGVVITGMSLGHIYDAKVGWLTIGIGVTLLGMVAMMLEYLGGKRG